MAALTTSELAPIRQEFVQTLAAIDVTKPTINAAIQAIEDWFEANRTAIGAAIEAAAPGAFTNAEKKALGKYWLFSKFGRE